MAQVLSSLRVSESCVQSSLSIVSGYFLPFYLARQSIVARGAEQKGRNPAQGSRGFGAP